MDTVLILHQCDSNVTSEERNIGLEIDASG